MTTVARIRCFDAIALCRLKRMQLSNDMTSRLPSPDEEIVVCL